MKHKVYKWIGFIADRNGNLTGEMLCFKSKNPVSFLKRNCSYLKNCIIYISYFGDHEIIDGKVNPGKVKVTLMMD